MKRMTIIGGGASGTLLAANLLRAAGERPLEVNMVEKNATIGRGVAYSTPDDIHLLNVPAAKMSAFPDEAEHFLGWLERSGYHLDKENLTGQNVQCKSGGQRWLVRALLHLCQRRDCYVCRDLFFVARRGRRETTSLHCRGSHSPT